MTVTFLYPIMSHNQFRCLVFVSPALKSALMNALGALTADHWETAQHCPEMFAPGGLYFDFVVRELGPLNDNQHCTLAFFPKKVCFPATMSEYLV